MADLGTSSGAAEAPNDVSAADRPARLPFVFMHDVRRELKTVAVPPMLLASSTLMALAWLGHLNFKEVPLVPAIFLCWLLVLPEYFLNVTALRFGHRIYSGAQMAAFRLCSGVVCVALVSRYVLGEELRSRQLVGFGIMLLAMALIASSRPGDEQLEIGDEPEEDS